jgi:hypothetical protein
MIKWLVERRRSRYAACRDRALQAERAVCICSYFLDRLEVQTYVLLNALLLSLLSPSLLQSRSQICLMHQMQHAMETLSASGGHGFVA